MECVMDHLIYGIIFTFAIEKLVHLVGFITRNLSQCRSHERPKNKENANFMPSYLSFTYLIFSQLFSVRRPDDVVIYNV